MALMLEIDAGKGTEVEVSDETGRVIGRAVLPGDGKQRVTLPIEPYSTRITLRTIAAPNGFRLYSYSIAK